MENIQLDYIIVSAIIAAFTWLAKSIIKPWSDAYLLRSQAFTAYVEDQGKRTAIMAEESQKQTGMLVSIANGTNSQLITLNQMNDSSQKLCKAGEHHCQAGSMATMIGTKLDQLAEYAKQAATKLEDKAEIPQPLL